MLRDLTVRDLSGTRILGDFTPPAGSPDAVVELLARLAVDRAVECAPATIWSACEPATTYRKERHA